VEKVEGLTTRRLAAADGWENRRRWPAGGAQEPGRGMPSVRRCSGLGGGAVVLGDRGDRVELLDGIEPRPKVLEEGALGSWRADRMPASSGGREQDVVRFL
jgi:hypothetical protein